MEEHFKNRGWQVQMPWGWKLPVGGPKPMQSG